MAKFFSKINNKVKKILLTPKLPTLEKVKTLNLGSTYGSKLIADNPDLNNCIMLSGGCGEDISFDIEFARKYNARVILVDPVPRSAVHVERVLARAGLPASTNYVASGNQPIEAYDLTGIEENQFTFYPNALWDKDEQLELFPPANKEHVSFSFMDLQKTKGAEASIYVKSITVPEILKLQGIKEISVLKLDIEGAQLEVIRNCFDNEIFPNQIIVEIDELFFPSIKGRKRAVSLLKLLKNQGYKPVVAREKFDLTFVRGL
jgi:FkbM family methyltransferase